VKRAVLVLLGLCFGCDSRGLVVITSLGSTPDAGGSIANPSGHYHMENLDRGLVAVSTPDGVYLGWRMIADVEYLDPPTRVAYVVYRDDAPLTTVKDSTNFLDLQGSPDVQYQVAAIVDGERQELSPKVTAWPQDYLRIPLQIPPAGVTPATCISPNEHYTYSAGDGSVGDLDGDGRYEIVLKWDPSNAKDNSIPGCTGDVLLDAYTLDGKQLWRIDLGPNIRAGSHYTQFLVYDFDGDGKAEVVVKTAPGTLDGNDNYLQTGPAATDDDSIVYRNSAGHILTGPEYLTVFEGATGAELATADFQPARGALTDWGPPDGGNRAYIFLSTAAFVSDQPDGTASGRPSIIMARGVYDRSALCAWNWRQNDLTQQNELTLLWTADSAQGTAYASQGADSMMVADANGDGAQEIIYGSSTIASNGTKRCSTGFGHGDTLHVGVLLDPSHQVNETDIQVFMVHQNGTQPAYDVHDAFTCDTIVKGPATGVDNREGVADDIDPNNPGAEMWSDASPVLLSATDGTNLGPKPSSSNFLIYWDADESRELEDDTSITKYGVGTLLSCAQCESNGGGKTPTLTADLFGDWREEIVWREADNSALRVYTTTDVTKRRIYTLMHDPQYRMQVSAEQTGFNQPPHPGFHIGNGMKMPPKPDIFVRPSQLPDL